jgi:CRP/FNR family cyclic AMP-dependent transcriptional regulator
MKSPTSIMKDYGMSDNVLFEKYGHVIPAGTVIFREGDEGNEIFIIQEGKVKISKSIGNNDHVLAILGKGDFFGEMAIVNRIRRTATAQTVTDTHLLAFDRQGFRSMIEKNSKIAMNIIDKLCRRLQQANMQIQQLKRKNAPALIALHLVYAFEGLPRKASLGQDLGRDLPFPRNALAGSGGDRTTLRSGRSCEKNWKYLTGLGSRSPPRPSGRTN